MQTKSYWLDSTPAFTGADPSPRIEGKVDVAVVGGGFTGLSAALALARRGASVAVLEAGAIASEASGRNGGHCNNGLALDFSATAKTFGLEKARAFYRAYDAGVDLIETLCREEAIDCDFVRSGKLKLAAKPHHLDGIRRAQEVLAREVDADTAVLTKADLAAEIGSDLYHGGLLQRRSASLHMGRFGQGLAMAAVKSGARIHENATVTRFRRVGGNHVLDTARGSIEASNVLLATGASTHGPLGWFRRRIVPIGSFMIVTAPLSPDQARAIMPGRRNCTTTRHIGNYFRLTADDRLLFGGRTRFAPSDAKNDAISGAMLRDALAGVFPQLGPVGIDYCWGGLIDMTADRFPRAGVRDGIHYTMGYSGHGVQMSVLMGRAMAEVMAGRPEANPWRDLPWPAIPGYTGRPWFLPFVGAYYRMKDHFS